MAYITDSEAARAAFTTATQKAKDAVTGLFNAYGFTLQNPDGTWSSATGGAAFDKAGYGIALSKNGKVALIGIYGDDIGSNSNQGSAVAFYRR